MTEKDEATVTEVKTMWSETLLEALYVAIFSLLFSKVIEFNLNSFISYDKALKLRAARLVATLCNLSIFLISRAGSCATEL